MIKKTFCIFLSYILVLSCFPAWEAAAELTPPGQGTYSFGPEGRPIEALNQEFSKPNEMMNIVPNRPVAARDKYGNRTYFTSNGKMTLKVNKDGTKEFSLGWNSRKYDASGNLAETSDWEQGSREVVSKNEKGQVTGYKELGYGSKVVKEFDHDKNLLKTYAYDKYGKNVEYVLNELSQSKTVYDKNSQPGHDLDFEGNIVSTYKYDKDGRLEQKIDLAGNITHFDNAGNMAYTTNLEGGVMLTYTYEKDEEGRNVLTKAVSRTGDATYYKDGRQQYTVTDKGAKTVEYFWDGSQLMYSFNNVNEGTTYYDINGREQYTCRDQDIIKEWLYVKGRLIGAYDGDSQTTTLFQYEREDIAIHSETRPTVEQIRKWQDEGLVARERSM